MDVRSCKNCGKLFNYLQGPAICPTCKKKMEMKFIEVREYIRENEYATIPEIAEHNDVSVKQIKQWIREERLIFREGSPVGIECENCGAMIRCGRYCDACKSSLANTLASAYSKKPVEKEVPASKKKDGSRMRFLQNY